MTCLNLQHLTLQPGEAVWWLGHTFWCLPLARHISKDERESKLNSWNFINSLPSPAPQKTLLTNPRLPETGSSFLLPLPPVLFFCSCVWPVSSPLPLRSACYLQDPSQEDSAKKQGEELQNIILKSLLFFLIKEELDFLLLSMALTWHILDSSRISSSFAIYCVFHSRPIPTPRSLLGQRSTVPSTPLTVSRVKRRGPKKHG